MSARILDDDDIITNLRLLEAKLTAEYHEVQAAVSQPSCLDTRLHYAARLRLVYRPSGVAFGPSQAARAPSGLRKRFFSISHAALQHAAKARTAARRSSMAWKMRRWTICSVSVRKSRSITPLVSGSPTKASLGAMPRKRICF
jgi:hypothetical protein